MTLHSAKDSSFQLCSWREWMRTCFLARGVFETLEIEEERRLCYVGITPSHGQALCGVSRHRMLYGTPAPTRRSRFIEEMPEELVHRVAAGDRRDRTLRGRKRWVRSAKESVAICPGSGAARNVRDWNGGGSLRERRRPGLHSGVSGQRCQEIDPKLCFARAGEVRGVPRGRSRETEGRGTQARNPLP